MTLTVGAAGQGKGRAAETDEACAVHGASRDSGRTGRDHLLQPSRHSPVWHPGGLSIGKLCVHLIHGAFSSCASQRRQLARFLPRPCMETAYCSDARSGVVKDPLLYHLSSIHITCGYWQGGWNRWTHVKKFGPLKMTPPGEDGTHFFATVAVPKNAYSIDFVMSNVPEGEGIYDNRGGLDYHLPVEGSEVRLTDLVLYHAGAKKSGKLCIQHCDDCMHAVMLLCVTEA